MTVTTAQAVTLLESVLFESATLAQANAARWVQLSASNTADSTVAGLASAMANSAEAGIAEQVVRYYQGALGRQPDSAEITYYMKIAETGLSASQIAQGAGAVPTSAWNQIAGYFAASPEYQSLTAGGNVITALYENILARAPSSDEVSFYQKALDGGTSVAALLEYFVNSTEYQTKVNAEIASQLAQGYASATPVIVDPPAAAGTVTVKLSTAAGLTVLGNTALSVTPNYEAATATTVFTLSSLNLAGMKITAGTSALTDIVVDSKVTNLTLNGLHDPVTIDLSHFSGTSAVTTSLPAGNENFTYEGLTVHITNSASAIELIGVSFSQITLLPAHS